MKYTDPDGREVNIDGDIENQEKILEMINSLSRSQYLIENNKLQKDESKINETGSLIYSSAIDSLIENGVTSIQIADTYRDQNGEQVPLSSDINGNLEAGYTYGSNLLKIMNVTVTGRNSDIIPADEGYANSSAPAEILMHELAGHAAPRIMGNLGNAVEIENSIRNELIINNNSITTALRKPDYSHGTHGQTR